MLPFQFLSPFKNDIQKWINQNQGGEIHKYVQDLISKSLNGSLQKNYINEAMGIFEQDQHQDQDQDDRVEVEPELKKQNLDYDTFETHDHVYVKIHIRDESQLSNVKIFHTSNQSIIEGIPTPNDQHVITLPSIVKVKGAKAEYRDHYLQIQIPKKVDMQYTEIDVQGID